MEATRGPLAVDRTCTEIVVSVLGDERFAPPLAPLSGDPHLDAAELLGCRDLETPLDNLSSKTDAKVERTLSTFLTTSPCNVSADCSLPLSRPIPRHELTRDRLNPPHDRGSGCPESEFSRGCTNGRPLETLPGVASKGVAFPRLRGFQRPSTVSMLPFSSSGSKMTPRHHVSGYSNGYPRGNTFEISPHRCVVTTLPCWLGRREGGITDERFSATDSHPEAQHHPSEDAGDFSFDSA